MKILLGGMHRSGINVVGKWLLRQSRLKSKPLDGLGMDWVETTTDYSFISQINHHGHGNYENFFQENTVATVEREEFEVLKEYFGKHPTFRRVVILRDFKNWLASVAKMQNSYRVMPLDVWKYATLLLEACQLTFFPRDEVFISYNKWCTSREYREEICDSLDLTYTNCGYRDVPSNGGGSSFDGTTYKDGSQMDTLNRWKQMDGPEFQYLMERYHKVLELSNRYFGLVTDSCEEKHKSGV